MAKQAQVIKQVSLSAQQAGFICRFLTEGVPPGAGAFSTKEMAQVSVQAQECITAIQEAFKPVEPVKPINRLEEQKQEAVNELAVQAATQEG